MEVFDAGETMTTASAVRPRILDRALQYLGDTFTALHFEAMEAFDAGDRTATDSATCRLTWDLVQVSQEEDSTQ